MLISLIKKKKKRYLVCHVEEWDKISNCGTTCRSAVTAQYLMRTQEILYY